MSTEDEENGVLGNWITAIDWRGVGNVNQKRELWGALLGVTAEECGPSIEPKSVNIGLVIGNRRELLGDGGSDLLGTVASCIKGDGPKSGRSKWEIGVGRK